MMVKSKSARCISARTAEDDIDVNLLLEEVVDLPNIKSAEKRVEIAKARTIVNKAMKSNLKTNLKKFDAAVAEGNRDEANSTYKVAVKAIDKAQKHGILHKNNAARKKSAIAKKLNTLA